MFGDIFVCPVGEERVQEALITSIETSILHSKVCNLAESIDAWAEDKDSGIEAIWPTDVWRGR